MIIDAEKCPELAAALALAQGEIEAAEKDRTNPAFRSKYATLASIRDAMRDPFARHGLSVTQAPVTYFDEGHLFTGVISTLRHKSGEAERSRLGLPVGDKVTPQTCGSAITYARRYALAGIAGVCPDDDDGNASSRRDDHRDEPAKPSPRMSQQPSAIDRAREQALAEAHEAFREYNAVHKNATGSPAVWDDAVAEFTSVTGRADVHPDERDANFYSHLASHLRKATEGLKSAVESAPKNGKRGKEARP